jgi:Carboxypeptidase regulatory-like domain
VSLYYRYSPPIAAFIAPHPWLRAVVRCALAPVVCGLAHPVIGVSSVAVAIPLLVLLMRRRILRHLTALSVGPFAGRPLRWLLTHYEGLARIILVLMLGLGLCPPAHAATGFGDSPVFTVNLQGLTSGLSVSGMVTDVNGRVLSGATVQAAKAGTLAAESATGPDGRYQLPPLGSGVYALAVSAPGFVTDHRLVSLVPASAEQDFTLKPPVVPPTLVSQDPHQPLPPSLAPPPQSDTSRLLVFDGKKWSTTAKVQPGLATVVLTHGWTRCINETADSTTAGVNDWPLAAANALTVIGIGNVANIVGWDWYEVSRPCFLGEFTPPPEEQTPDQGVLLGEALYQALGSGYERPIHFLAEVYKLWLYSGICG